MYLIPKSNLSSSGRITLYSLGLRCTELYAVSVYFLLLKSGIFECRLGYRRTELTMLVCATATEISGQKVALSWHGWAVFARHMVGFPGSNITRLLGREVIFCLCNFLMPMVSYEQRSPARPFAQGVEVTRTWYRCRLPVGQQYEPSFREQRARRPFFRYRYRQTNAYIME